MPFLNCHHADTRYIDIPWFVNSDIEICEKYADHWCAIYDIYDYLIDQQKTCMKPGIEKYYDGMVTYKEEISHAHWF